MVQKGRETTELESSRGNKRQKVPEAPAHHDTRNASTKRQSRVSDQTSPTPSRKRNRTGSVLQSPIETVVVKQEAEIVINTGSTTEVEVNIATIREHEVERRMELIKQLMEQKENELKELAYLEAGNNRMDYDTGFTKGKPIQTAKEDPGDGVLVVSGVDAPNKKGPGRPAKDPNSQSRRKSHSTVGQSPVHGEPLQVQSSPVAQASSAPHTPVQSVQPTPQTPTQPAEPTPQDPKAPVFVPPLQPAVPSIFAAPPSISEQDHARAERDAAIIRRVGELQRTGMWSLKRIPKATEPSRAKVHWDHVLTEMAWLANDFKQERKWKMALAKKVSKQVMKYHQMLETREQRKRKEEENQIRKVASGIAREVKRFWQKIEKVVMFKHQTKLDEKKKEVLDKHLDFLVGQTERYFEMIANDLKQPEGEPQPKDPSTEQPGEVNAEGKPAEKSLRTSRTQDLLMEAEEAEGEVADDDAEFVLPEGAVDEADDEETLEEEETKEDSNDLPKGEEELSQLQRESEMPLEDIIKQFKEQGGGEGEQEEADADADADEDDEGEDDDGKTGTERISAAAAAANAAQPTGFTLSTTKVKTKVPFLLHGTLREYQHIGLDWIVTMYEKRLNGILADEMGLGKTIMTIAMLAHLACEKGIWGPHLIVVPTSVMLNWEMEFKKWCPAFKILTYFGTQKERKLKRQGWSKTNSFHVCITSYKVVVQDQQAFRRKKWKYFILDEAHNIKNFRSQRWQILLNFNSKRRLLLTGTPLQNNLMELWSLMHFLMPHMFQSHKEFKDWFSNPVTNMIEGTETLNEDLITRLHAVLRPFLLRRMKKDVEKQLPNKYHHVVTCQLSKRQRFLYEDFMSSAVTQDTLKSGNFLGIINVLMQLRKVCNHPDLFEGRPIISPFDMDPIEFYTSSAVCRALEEDPFKSVNLPFLNLNLASTELDVGHMQALRISQLRTPSPKIIELSSTPSSKPTPPTSFAPSTSGPSMLDELRAIREARIYQERLDNLKRAAYINEFRCARKPLFGWELIRFVHIHRPVHDVHIYAEDPKHLLDYSTTLTDLVRLPKSRAAELNPTLITQFVCIIPKARASPPRIACPHPNPSTLLATNRLAHELSLKLSPTVDILRPAFVRSQVYFPDKSLVQYDCGKLQQLDILLRKLKSGAHRALIFTQMTRMLDVLEAFLSLHGHTYLRLDGSTKVEKRQQLTERFNKDPKVFVFILSTRSGGVGINLTGADSVIFYDSDWNPAMDAQAQDRCHRIGQTRDVHIYRLVTEFTIEENIVKKANQKRHLDDMVIKGGGFTTDFFKNVDIRDLFDSTKDQLDRESAPIQLKENRAAITQQDWESAVANAEDETDAIALRQAQAEQDVDHEEFNEEASQHTESQPNGPVTTTTTGDHDMSFLQQEDDYELQAANGKLASSTSGFEFEDSLLPIQRYAVHFLEAVNPAVNQESIEAMNEQAETREQEWELEHIKRMKEEEEERMSEDDDLLFYEVSGNAAEFRAKLLEEMEVYCPPNPDLEHLYIPPFDGDYLSQLPPLPPPFPDEDEAATPSQNEPPDKKSPPLSPPGEVDAEPYTSSSSSRREKRDKRKQAPSSEVPQSPPSPPAATIKSRARKDRSGFFPRIGPKNARGGGGGGEGKKIAPSAHKDLHPWSPEEDEALTSATRTYGLNWDLACEVLLSNPSLPSRKFTRTPTACAERYRMVLQPRAAGEVEKEKDRKSPPSSPLMSPPQAQPHHFGILDVIRNMVNQKKDIPGMIGSAAQTDQSVPPHASHQQAAIHAGITSTKPLTPRDVIALLSQRVALTMPQKEIPVLTKLAYKIDPKMSGFGQGQSLMGSSMANAIAGASQGTAAAPQNGVQPNALNAGQATAPNIPAGGAATFTVPGPGVVVGSAGGVGATVGVSVGVPAANSIILNPNGSNVQTSRKLAQINQSMLPSAPNVTVLPRANSTGSVPTVNAAPAVVVAIPTNVTVLPRSNSTNTINPTPIAPTINTTTPTAVLPSTTTQPPAAASKPSPSKRSKKNSENGTTSKRQRTKNNAAAVAAAAAAVAATSPAVAEQPQLTPAQSTQPLSQPAQPTQPPIQHPQMHQLQQIQHQLQQQHLQHQQQPQQQLHTAQPQQPAQLLHTQPQPAHMHPQYQHSTPQPQTQQTTVSGQTNPSVTPLYTTTPAYTPAPTYATGAAYAAPTSYTTPTAGITYSTTYTTPAYTTAPSSAPSTYTTSTFTNATAPGTYTAPAYTGASPPATYAPTTTPTTYVAPTAARPFTTAPAGSTFTGAPATYIATSAPASSFTTPATAPYTPSGYTPQGMVIGIQMLYSSLPSPLSPLPSPLHQCI